MKGIVTLAVAATLASAGPALAHHSFAAEYDDQKPLKITGTLTKVDWMNPHIWYYVDVKNPDGTVSTWAISGGAPGQLMRAGSPRTCSWWARRSTSKASRPRTAPTTGLDSASPTRTAATCSRPPTRQAARRSAEEASHEAHVVAVALPRARDRLSVRAFPDGVGRRTAAGEPRGHPRTADGKPDFTGTYQWPTYLPGDERGRSSATVFDRKRFAPLKPGGDAFLEPRTGEPRHDEPRDFCMPAGFPGGMLSANAMQFFQTKNHLVMVHEFQRMSRVIPLDGRAHRTGARSRCSTAIRWDGGTATRW